MQNRKYFHYQAGTTIANKMPGVDREMPEINSRDFNARPIRRVSCFHTARSHSWSLPASLPLTRLGRYFVYLSLYS
jgi:hypothetical protein